LDPDHPTPVQGRYHNEGLLPPRVVAFRECHLLERVYRLFPVIAGIRTISCYQEVSFGPGEGKVKAGPGTMQRE